MIKLFTVLFRAIAAEHSHAIAVATEPPEFAQG